MNKQVKILIGIAVTVVIIVIIMNIVNMNKNKGYNKLSRDLVRKDRDIKVVTVDELEKIQENEKGKNIIKKLGATKDVSSIDEDKIIAQYKVYDEENEEEYDLLIAIIDEDQILGKSGKELIEKSKKDTIINKAYDYLDDKTKSEIINLDETLVEEITVEDEHFTYIDDNNEVQEISKDEDKDVILVDFEKNEESGTDNKVIVIIDGDIGEVLGVKVLW